MVTKMLVWEPEEVCCGEFAVLLNGWYTWFRFGVYLQWRARDECGERCRWIV